MIVKNPWVGYLTRSYKQIKRSVIERLKINTPEITDYTDSNLLIIIVSIFSGIAEQLNYYIDNMAREAFISTTRRLSSILKLVKLTNYQVRAAISSYVDITFTAVDASGDPVILASGNTLIIPSGTVVSTSDGLEFITTEDAYIAANHFSIIVPCRQRSPVSSYVLGTSDGSANQRFQLPSFFEHNSDVVTIDSIVWERKQYLDLSLPNEKHYMVEIGSDGIPYMVFGDNINGKIPDASLDIYLDYNETKGGLGNVDAGMITTLNSVLAIPSQSPAISEVLVNNEFESLGGLGIEGLEEIRRNAILSLRTLDRAVTRQDYIDIAKLAPGVGKAALHFDCTKEIEIYISPVGGGIANQSLINSTSDYIDERRMVTTFVTVYPAGETIIGIKLEVTGKFRVQASVVESDIKEALLNRYSSQNSDIDLAIRISDIIALVDNLPTVDYLSLTYIYTIPYARPSSTLPELDWTRKTLDGSIEEVNWKIIFVWNSGSPYFNFYKNNVFITSLYTTDPLTDIGGYNILQAKINGVTGLTSSHNGLSWSFKTYPYNENIVLNDFTVPAIDLDYLELNITEKRFIN